MTNREWVAAGWAARGFGCELWTDSPGRRREDFTHDKDDVAVLLTPADTVHSARNNGSTRGGCTDIAVNRGIGDPTWEHKDDDNYAKPSYAPPVELFISGDDRDGVGGLSGEGGATPDGVGSAQAAATPYPGKHNIVWRRVRFSHLAGRLVCRK